MSTKLYFLLLGCIISNLCYCQTYSHLEKSDTISLKSIYFDTLRKVIITKAKQPLQGNAQNYILYTDAHDSSINGMLLQSANNLIGTKEIPSSTLIGIIHEQRDQELLEKDKLLDFISKELIPFLEQEEKQKINDIAIVGHSFGAYFATYAFIQNNALFNACIAISPAYWPNNQDVLDLLAKQKTHLKGSFFLASADKRWDEISLRKYIFKAKEIIQQNPL